MFLTFFLEKDPLKSGMNLFQLTLQAFCYLAQTFYQLANSRDFAQVESCFSTNVFPGT